MMTPLSLEYHKEDDALDFTYMSGITGFIADILSTCQEWMERTCMVSWKCQSA